MDLKAFRGHLVEHYEKSVRFVLPDGEPIPAEAHVTEVGHVAKRFIDCGGTVRSQESCLLQAWIAERDGEHRLSAGKLARILDLSRVVLPSEDLGVELEYDRGAVGQYTLVSAEARGDELFFALGNKKTDCLARESCGVAPAASGCGCDGIESKCC